MFFDILFGPNKGIISHGYYNVAFFSEIYDEIIKAIN